MAKKDIVKCHAENRKAFLGPGCEGHERMKKEAYKKNNNDMECKPGAVPLKFLQEAKKTTV